MVDRDYYNDTTPHLKHHGFRGPTVQELKTALVAFDSTTYSAAKTQGMTKQDLMYAARHNNLTVTDTSL